MKRRVCMKRLRRLKCKCHETRHFVRNEMSRIVIFLSWKKVTNRDFFFVVRNGPNTSSKRPYVGTTHLCNNCREHKRVTNRHNR